MRTIDHDAPLSSPEILSPPSVGAANTLSMLRDFRHAGAASSSAAAGVASSAFDAVALGEGARSLVSARALDEAAAAHAPRAAITIQTNAPAGLPHLDPSDPPVVPVLPDGRCLYYCVVAADDARRWLATHTSRGVGIGVERMRADAAAADGVRDRLVQQLRVEGLADVAARLTLSGPDSYPSTDELGPLARALGCQLLLSVGDVQSTTGDGPLLMHIRQCDITDDGGHVAPHFELIQSWCPRRSYLSSFPGTPAARTVDDSPDAQPRSPDRRLAGGEASAAAAPLVPESAQQPGENELPQTVGAPVSPTLAATARLQTDTAQMFRDILEGAAEDTALAEGAGGPPRDE